LVLLKSQGKDDNTKGQSDSCKRLSKQIVQIAEDFDMDGIQKLADGSDAC